jgi:hypothetical protein
MPELQDREVGELWREALENFDGHREVASRIMNLIRKLVEERTKGNWAALPFVLREFGIKEEEWK